MCTTCGCGAGETRIEGDALAGEHDEPAGHEIPEHWHTQVDAQGNMASQAHQYRAAPAHVAHEHSHTHADGSVHTHSHAPSAAPRLDYGSGAARAHAPGMTQSRMVQIERDILSKNDAYAGKNRQLLADCGILALNFVSSPGSGKTSLLCKTVAALQGKRSVAVIEGDQQTANDAERIRASGAPAIQINTGKGCHLDAYMVGQALEKLRKTQQIADDALLFIENVGNLVCPAAFDLGEAAKVAILSVTEGEDKPLKYPDMFQAARLLLLNKIDLLPHLVYDVEQAIAAARRVNPQIEIIQISATSGAGMAAWLAWLEARYDETQQAKLRTVAALRRKVEQLEAELAQNAAPAAS